MKKLIILILFLINLFSYDLKKVDFATFCNYVSYSLNLNIVLSEDVPKNFSIFMPTDNMTPGDLKRSFFELLNSLNLNYKVYNNTILIYKVKPKQEQRLNYIIKFDYIPYDVIINNLKSFFPDVKFSIFQNRLLINATSEEYVKILYLITSLQNSYKKAKINFLISVIDNKKAKQFSINTKFKNPFDRFLLNFVSSTATITDKLPSNYSFTSFINFLQSKGISQTISKPTINLIDSKDYVLESVHNVPYISKSISVDKNGNPYTQTDLKYKDIGLKIYIKNVFITDKSIDFDLDLYVQNIVAYISENQPVTDTKHFNTHIQLTKENSKYLIAGLRSVTTIQNKSEVPYLSKIPLIGLLFKTNDKKVEDLSFTFYISTTYFDKRKSSPALSRSDVGAPQRGRR